MRIPILLCCLFCILVFAPAQSTRYPFPQHTGYSAGTIKPDTVSQAEMDDSVRSFYNQWKALYLIPGCDSGQYYVFYNYGGMSLPPDGICVSEGQGYGMLITALMAGYDPNAKTYFDGLYNYYRAHPSRMNERLMAWRQRTGCISLSDDSSSATDGDLDIAYALLLADKQWGSDGGINYRNEALFMIDAIMADEINYNIFSVKLGDWSSASEPMYFNATRSSDFMLNHFRAFESVTGDSRWGNVREMCYSIISTIQTNNSPVTGLLPDFIKNANTTPIPAQSNFLEGPHDGKYYYNACRDPWRIATDYLLSGDSRAKTAVQKMNSWFKTTTGGNVFNLRAGYTLSGTVIHNDYVDLAFLSPLLAGAMVDSSNRHWLNKLWKIVTEAEILSDGYYGNTLKLLSMIVASGNWWDPSRQRVIEFSGRLWEVKNSGAEQWGPGPNFFSDHTSNVWVDSNGKLHLKITNRDSAWQCAEVSLTQSLGYGKYVFHLESEVGALNENAVLGLFTWDNDSAEAHREIDIEFARWGNASDPTNAQFVVQPYDNPGNMLRWAIPETLRVSANSIHWSADSIGFLSVGGTSIFPPYEAVNAGWQYSGDDVPSAGNERAIINLWLAGGNSPSDSQEIEVVISKFEFNPATPFPEQPELSAPADEEISNSMPLFFRWNASALAETYHLQISNSPSFSTLLINDSTIVDTSYSVGTLISGTTYYWRVRSKNTSGISAWSDAFSVTFISVNKWKLVSLPFIVADPRKTTVFPTALSHAFMYTNAGYIQSDTLIQGKGYWVKFGADTTTNAPGDSIAADTLELVAGWNLVGSVSLPVPAVTITAEPADIIESNFFGYESGYMQAEAILPGRAYWVKAKANGILILR